MRTEYYKKLIDMAASLPAMDAVIEDAAMDDALTNEQYEEVYSYAMHKLLKQAF